MAADHSSRHPYRLTHDRKGKCREPIPLNVDDIARRYLAGETTEDIAGIYGVHRQTIGNRLRSRGIRLRRGREHVIDMDEAIRRYRGGEHVEAIGRDMGISAIALRERFIKAGVTLRGPAEIGLSRRIIPDPSVKGRYLSGESIKSIANSLSLHENVIARFLAESGIRLRTRAEIDAIRRAKMTPEKIKAARLKTAASKERNPYEGAIGLGEIEVSMRLRMAGVEVVQQKAVGTYNIDVAIPESRVAVELLGSGAVARKSSANRFRDRSRFLHDHGWVIVVVRLLKRYGLKQAAIDFIIDIHAKRLLGLVGDRATWIVRGDGKPIIPRPGEDSWRTAILDA